MTVVVVRSARSAKSVHAADGRLVVSFHVHLGLYPTKCYIPVTTMSTGIRHFCDEFQRLAPETNDGMIGAGVSTYSRDCTKRTSETVRLEEIRYFETEEWARM